MAARSNWKVVGYSVAAVTLVALASLIPATLAISCWECNSKTDSSCADISPATSKSDARYKDCSIKGGFDYKLCRKQVQDVDGEIRIIRSCGFEESPKDCYTTANPPVKTTVCQCMQDGCNPATRPQATMGALLGGLTLGLVYYLKMKSTI